MVKIAQKMKKWEPIFSYRPLNERPLCFGHNFFHVTSFLLATRVQEVTFDANLYIYYVLFLMCFFTSNLLLRPLSHLVQALNSKSDRLQPSCPRTKPIPFLMTINFLPPLFLCLLLVYTFKC